MKPRVLIVDDSLTVRMDLNEAFTEASFEPVLCQDLASARKAMQESNVELVVLDVNLPDGDGFDFLQEIRSNTVTASVPVLMLSSEADAPDRVRGLVGGADGYIGKPYDDHTLIDRANILTRRKSKQTEAGQPLILVIDDSPTFREALRTALEMRQFSVQVAGSGEEGLRIAGQCRPDALIVDGQLPGIDGPTVIRRLKSDPILRSLPVLLLTASLGKAEEIRALDAGADGYVRKEEGTEVVLARLKGLLRTASRSTDIDHQNTPSCLPRLLVIDDSIVFRDAVARELEGDGYELYRAASGKEALGLLSKQAVDCILLDLVMPDMDGEVACCRIKSMVGCQDVPVMILTEHNDPVAHLRCIAAGADDYVPKEVGFEVLKGRVRSQLRRKQSERENRLNQEVVISLRKSEALLRGLFEQAPDAIVVTDHTGRIVRINAQVERMFGFLPSELIGSASHRLFPEEFRAQYLELQKSVLNDGVFRSSSDHELFGLRKNGAVFPVDLAIGNIVSSETRLLIATIRDISSKRDSEQKLKKLENRLLQTQKMEAIGRLAAGVAHDFNNLLTVINGYSELAIESLPPKDAARELLSEIRLAGERAAGLTRQLLAFSRQQVVSPRIVDLNAIVSDLERMLIRMIGDDVRVSTVLAQDLGAIQADPGQIEQVLMNLAVNARDAMPKGGQLTIETRNIDLDRSYTDSRPDLTPGAYVQLAISDSGCGMSSEVKTRIFEPFFTTKEVGKGTGLGLATVYGIVQQCRGAIDVYSEEGVGTTFKVFLPHADAPAESDVRLDNRKPTPLGNETLLLAEDDPTVRSLATRVLGACGYTVLTASHGVEAIQIASVYQGPIHLVITDVVMPQMSGRQLIESIRATRPSTQALFVSGYTDDAIIRHGVLTDAIEFLQKPFSPSALASKVRNILDSKDL